MKLGVFASCLHDRDLEGVLSAAATAGLTSLELSAGGYFPAPHLHMDALRVSENARAELLGRLASAGVVLGAINASGNPLHPDAAVAAGHAADLHRAIDVAGSLGVRTIVTQTGAPGAEANATLPSWVVSPWDSAYSDALDYQWSVAIPFWKDAAARAEQAGVRLAIEPHPHQLVYNPPTLERLIDAVDSPAIGLEMDPSHLFWQGIDPLETIARFGERVFIAAAKDTRINDENVRRNGLLNNLWRRNVYQPPIGLGGRFELNAPPTDASYEFVAIGKGHDLAFWADWLLALHRVDPEMVVSIEHEDAELGPLEGLVHSGDALRDAAGVAGLTFDR